MRDVRVLGRRKVMDLMKQKRKTFGDPKRILSCACVAVLAGAWTLGGIAMHTQVAEGASFRTLTQEEIMRSEEQKLIWQREQHEAELDKMEASLDKSEGDARMYSQLAWRAYKLGCEDYVARYASQVVQALDAKPARTQEEADMLVKADVLLCVTKLTQKTPDLAGAAEVQAAAAQVAPDHWMVHYAAGRLAEEAYHEKKDAATLAQAAKDYEAANQAAGEHGAAWVGLRLRGLIKEPSWDDAMNTLPRADRKAIYATILQIKQSRHAGDYFAPFVFSSFVPRYSAILY